MKQIGRLGEMGVAIDNFDAFEKRVYSAAIRFIIDLADVPSGRPAFREPVPLGVLDAGFHYRAAWFVVCHGDSLVRLPKLYG